jgi:hypothetical protein
MAQLKGAGTEDRKKVAIAAALGLVVLVLAIRTLIGGPSVPPPPAPVATVTPAATPARTTTNTSTSATPKAPSGTLDPTLHPELMAENESLVYSGSGRNIFSANSIAPVQMAKIEAPKGPIRPVAVVPSGPPPPPPPPAIDLRFFGYSARKDGARKAFLLHGDDVFVAAEGDVVSHRYKVVKIQPLSVSIEDIPYHNTQSLPLVQN